MDDGSRAKNSFLNDFKIEWHLFWESITIHDDGNTNLKSLIAEKAENLDVSKLKVIEKNLSENRKNLNQKLESLNKEIELNMAKLDSLMVVGGESAETLSRISELTDHGEEINQQLQKLEKVKRDLIGYQSHLEL